MFLDIKDIDSWRYVDNIPYVHDIQVKDTHNYFIDCQGLEILVHNSSKTISILQNIARLACTTNYTITIVGEDMPNLTVGAMRDFKELLEKSSSFAKFCTNPKAERPPFRFITGATVEFKSFDSPQDAKGSRRDVLYVNECNGVSYEIVDELISRTREIVFLDYNPNAKFWVHHYLLEDKNQKDDIDYFISNFSHNKMIPKNNLKRILGWKRKMEETGKTYWINKWNVYGLGLTGVTEGAVFINVIRIKSIPVFKIMRKPFKQVYGLDFGFSQDPTALCLCIVQGDDLYLKELLYKYKLTTPALIKELEKLNISKDDPIFADPQNGESILLLQDAGFNCVPARKGSGSISAGIDLINSKNIHITENSLNWSLEIDNYVYKKVDGQYTDEPIKDHNHLWDSARYCLTEVEGLKNRQPRDKIRRHKRKLITFDW